MGCSGSSLTLLLLLCVVGLCSFPVDGGDVDLLFLAVQCCDVDRSFFLLSFSFTALQPTMAIVQGASRS